MKTGLSIFIALCLVSLSFQQAGVKVVSAEPYCNEVPANSYAMGNCNSAWAVVAADVLSSA